MTIQYKPRVAYFDADQLQYRFAFKHQDKITKEVDTQKALEDVLNYINNILYALNADQAVMVFSTGLNFRKYLNRCYKYKRGDKDKPMLLSVIRQHLIDNFKCVMHDWLEADDLLGIIMTQPQNSEERILVSYDKDLRSIPGLHYNPEMKCGTDNRSLIMINEFEAEMEFWKASIAGDNVDCYTGIPLLGKNFIEEHAIPTLTALPDKLSRFEWVVERFAWAYLNKEYALRQMRMAYILHYEDFDLEKNSIKLFNPEKEEWLKLDEINKNYNLLDPIKLL